MLILNAQNGETFAVRPIQNFESTQACLSVQVMTPIAHMRNGMIEVFICATEPSKDLST